MTADPSSLQTVLFDEEEGPDGIVLAGWGLTAVLAFVVAYAAFQFSSTSVAGKIRLAPPGEVELTGSIDRADPPIGTFVDASEQKSDRFAPDFKMIEIDDLRREIGDLRRTIATLRIMNDQIRKRLDQMTVASNDVDGGDITGSIGENATTKPESIAVKSPTPVSAKTNSNVTVKVRRLDPIKDLPAAESPRGAEIKAPSPDKTGSAAKTSTPPSGQPATLSPNTSAVRDVTPKPEQAAQTAAKPLPPMPPMPVLTPQMTAEAPPATSTSEPRKEPRQPKKPVVMIDGKLPIDAALPGVDDSIITGSITAAAPRLIIPPLKPGEQQTALSNASLRPMDATGLAIPAKPKTLPGAVRPTKVAPGQGSQPLLSRSVFGVDLGGFSSFKDLEKKWKAFSASHQSKIEGLVPLASLGERDGVLEVRLLAGPFTNAANAMKLCATLMTTGVACQPSIYSGQPFTGP